MKIKEISLGHAVMVEYILKEEYKQPEKKVSKPTILQKNLSLDDYAQLYYNENLITVNNQKYPFVLLNEFSNLKTQSISILPRRYEVPPYLKKATDEILKHKLTPQTFDGPSIGIYDVIIDRKKTLLKIQKMGYFDFVKTNLSMDVYLSQFDKRFSENTTLRDNEIENGKSIELKYSNLANMLGLGFMVYNEKNNYIIMGQRKKGLAVEGGTLGILGGTPEWINAWESSINLNFGGYLQKHIESEMEEELCLEPSEIKFCKGYWLKDFTRAPDIMAHLIVNIPIEDIAERCMKSKTALKEHASIYKVPATRDMLNALLNKASGYEINNPSKVFFHLLLKEL